MFLSHRKCWALSDDIKILEESLESPKMWALIAKKLPGRNQHQIKNRFISLLSKDACLPRTKIIEILKERELIPMSMKTLENLKIAQEEEKLRLETQTLYFHEISMDFLGSF